VLTPLPRVSAETRARLVAEIDEKGSEAFTTEAIVELENNNPELLQMAHNYASGLRDYLQAMQGFALLYKALLIQSRAERTKLH
jgi:acyl-homoserine lactone acylase PvdQ